MKQVELVIKYIELPLLRMAPYIKGKNPFSATDFPNEPYGYAKFPVVVKSDMSKDDILLEAIKSRNLLVAKWLELGNCTGRDKV